jgi:predicted metallopeptidase
MEKEIVRQVTSLEDKITVLEPEPEELSDEKVKVIIHEVLTERYYSKRK